MPTMSGPIEGPGEKYLIGHGMSKLWQVTQRNGHRRPNLQEGEKYNSTGTTGMETTVSTPTSRPRLQVGWCYNYTQNFTYAIAASYDNVFDCNYSGNRYIKCVC